MKKIYLIIAFVIITGTIVVLWPKILTHKQEQEQVFCTQEALICPNGSYVGRTGPKCEFSPCPNQTSFIGTLRQNSGNFDLILPAPENSGGIEVSYVMPLIFKTGNPSNSLIGRKIEVFGSFVQGNNLSVDRIEPMSGESADPTLGNVRVGQSVFINGVIITLNRVVEDSRCPVDVQCFWAGRVTVNVSLKSDTDKETINISSDQNPVPFDSFKISIVKVNPARTSTTAPKTGDYTLTFKVAAN